MTKPITLERCRLRADAPQQEIDGFGVNINSKYWNGGALAPVVDRLQDELGATMFRVDVFGTSDWIDPEGTSGPSALSEAALEAAYTSRVAQNGWGMIRHLNARGIAPYLTASGDVPRWMLASDGRMLADFVGFARLMASFLEWAVKREGLRVRCFGCLNETDLGSPEGPSLDPRGYVEATQVLARELAARGLAEIPLVVAEQGRFDCRFVQEMIAAPLLARSVGIIGMHTYSDLSVDDYRRPLDLLRGTPFSGSRAWMTEYGDLDQTGEREWYVAWASTRRLLDLLEAGFNGAMVWDAYDNIHDHDRSWTIYGILRVGLRAFTPKKRYQAARQVYRWVRPGMRRIAAEPRATEKLRLVGFADDRLESFTLVGMNASPEPVLLVVEPAGFSPALARKPVRHFRTSESEDCVELPPARVVCGQYPYDGVSVEVPPHSIFTLTTLGN